MENYTNLIIYRPKKNSLMDRVLTLLQKCSKENCSEDPDLLSDAYLESMQELITTCEEHGFSGNLWHCFMTYYLVYHENSYSKACEIKGAVQSGSSKAALSDFSIFLKLFRCDFAAVERITGCSVYHLIEDYQAEDGSNKICNTRIRDRICTLSRQLASCTNAEEFNVALTTFYHDFGVGKFGLHKAFRIHHKENGAKIIPITNMSHVYLEDLVGYENAKQKLIENTEAFVKGRKANNCLLYGDAGTGKSSSIKGILNRYYDQGLRIIEIYKHQFKDLNDVIGQIKNRNYKFIIYMDDLSFEEFETDYKYLKAVIEGGLEKKPDNILIYATSNRRHLIRENFSDKEEIREDMHTSDTVQEKLSLVSRFGVTIYFGKPNKKEFQNIVKVLADRYHVTMSTEELYAKANTWELQHGGLSGRTAQQFIDHLLGLSD